MDAGVDGAQHAGELAVAGEGDQLLVEELVDAQPASATASRQTAASASISSGVARRQASGTAPSSTTRRAS
jgi:hypothetical protein